MLLTWNRAIKQFVKAICEPPQTKPHVSVSRGRLSAFGVMAGKDQLVQMGQQLSEEDYNAMLLALNETSLVSVANVKGDIVYANQKFVEVSGYRLEELLGQNHRILKSGKQPDELFVNLWQTISSGKLWRGEIMNRAKDGSYYWVDTSIVPILNEEGAPERYIAVRVLISDKKLIETELRQKNDELESFNSTLVGRELRMVELKKEITELKKRLEEEGRLVEMPGFEPGSSSGVC